jgi:zinc transporter ZupT
MNALAPTPVASPKLTLFEIVAHGLADGLSVYVVLDSLWYQRGWDDLIQVSLALLVILLSVVVTVRRFQPETRGLRVLEQGLSGLVAFLGLIGAVITLLFMASGATYKGRSPDAGGMAVMVGFLLFYPAAGLFVLPFALNASRLSSQLRRRMRWLCFMLVLLPVCVLVGVRLIDHQLTR